MWLLERFYPDHKSIAEFRRVHRDAVTSAGAALVRFAQSCGLIKGEWVAIDGTKFRAVSSVGERQALERYLDSCEQADEEAQAEIDPTAIQAALDKLKRHPEPDARFRRGNGGFAPAYNVQTVVDAEHALIGTHGITLDAADNRQLEPMAEAAQKALGCEHLNLAADAGYSNSEQAARCESKGLMPHVPANRAINNQGGGDMFDLTKFRYQPDTDTYLCPANKTLRRKQLHQRDKATYYRAAPQGCGTCSMEPQCTPSPARMLKRLLHEDALNRMHARATPEAMKLRRSIVEHPFAALKYHIFGHPRLLLRGTRGAQIEISLATMAYNLKRMVNILGATKLTAKLTPA